MRSPAMRRCSPRRALGFVLLASAVIAPNAMVGAQTIVIENATIVDIAARDSLHVASIVVDSGRITAIGANVDAPADAQKVDGRGRFVVPGLWDMHAHLATQGPVGRAPERYVGHGVLGVRDMGGHLQELTALRRRVGSGARVGPELVIAGPTLNGERPADFHRKVATAAEARAAVAELQAAGVDFIKIHRAMSAEAFYAIATASRETGLPFAGHVPLTLSWIDAVDAGMHTIEHIQTIFENLQPDPRRLVVEFDELADALEGTRGDAIFAALAANGTYFDPTLVGYERSIEQASPEIAAMRSAAFIRMKRIAARASAAGVRIVTGTDVLDEHGEMLLRELELLVEIGLTPRQVLAAATVTSANAAGRPQLGRVATGAPAFLLVVDGNPLHDIRQLRSLFAVVLRTELFRTDELRALRR